MASFGIASIIISVLAIFVPGFGIMLSGLSGVMAWLSAGRGVTLGGAAVIINFLNLFFLSPGYMIAAGIEASARNYEEQKLVVIWMIVLFIQIAAVIIFVINIFIDKLPSISIKSKKPTRTRWQQQPPTDREENNQILNPANSIIPDQNEPISKVTKVLIHKVHGGRKKDSKFWNDDIDLSKKADDKFDIAIDSAQKRRKRELQQPWMIPPALILITVVILVVARPDLFPFLDYHKVYKTLERIDARSMANEEALNIQKKVRPKTYPVSKPQIPVRYKNPYPSSEKQTSQSYASNNIHNDVTSNISLEGSVFAWKDNNGQRHFSNTNYPIDNPTLQVQTEINTYRKVTKVRVNGNRIYVPVTLRNNRYSTTTWMLLDTGCSITNIPYSQLNKIHANYEGAISLIVADGRKTTGRRATIDSIQIGSQKERNFKVAGTKVAGSSNKGLLGLDFLKRRPFKIDYDRQMLVWM